MLMAPQENLVLLWLTGYVFSTRTHNIPITPVSQGASKTPGVLKFFDVTRVSH